VKKQPLTWRTTRKNKPPGRFFGGGVRGGGANEQSGTDGSRRNSPQDKKKIANSVFGVGERKGMTVGKKVAHNRRKVVGSLKTSNNQKLLMGGGKKKANFAHCTVLEKTLLMRWKWPNVREKEGRNRSWKTSI